MRNKCRTIVLVTILTQAAALWAQVPRIITYQGRVSVNGTNFTGTGQFKFALVNAAGSVTYWSNDGTSSGGSGPTAFVSLGVTNGLFAVGLGDTSLANMTQPVPYSAFANSDVRVRIWFNNGVLGFQQLSPDQRITSAGYAMYAGNVEATSDVTAARLNIGSGNTLSGTLATVAGGTGNTASGEASTIGGGNGNTASWRGATVSGGYQNNAASYYDTVSGGQGNLATGGGYATVGGGYSNMATGWVSTVSGGSWNQATWSYATVAGGRLNVASGFAAVVSGGGGSVGNVASGHYSAIGGGMGNVASGFGAVVSGGGVDENGIVLGNVAMGTDSAVGGGMGNTTTGDGSTVSGGYSNTASSSYATVGGGEKNTASGDYATVPGGYQNVAGGQSSFAAGNRAKAVNSGTFVWADSQAADFTSTATNQFLIRASGGVGIGTTTPSAAALDVSSGDVRIDNHDLFLTTTSTTNNGSGLGYRPRLPGISGDGPFLYGYNGGGLGGLGPTTVALSWDYMGNVWVSNNLSTASLTVRNGATVTGTMTANSFTGNGAGLTSAGLLQASVLNVNAVGGVSFSTDYVKVGDLGSFTKLQAGSTIEITFDGRLTAMTMAGTGAAFELRIDDAASTVGWARATLKASQAGYDGGQTSITGIFAGLGTGSHTVNMYVQGANGGGTGAYVAGGNHSTDHVVVKEIK